MGDKLKAGNMGPRGNESVTPSAFVNSMAAKIEEELSALLVGEGRDALDLSDNSSETRDRRVLFVAIAKGIIEHLVANQDAFKIVTTSNVDGFLTSAKIEIQTE
jgi:hypothetical protein